MAGKYLSTFLKSTYVVFMFVGMVYIIPAHGYLPALLFAGFLTLVCAYTLHKINPSIEDSDNESENIQHPPLNVFISVFLNILGCLGVILYFLTVIFTVIAIAGINKHGGLPFYVNGIFALICFTFAKVFCYIGGVKDWRIFDKYNRGKETFTYEPDKD